MLAMISRPEHSDASEENPAQPSTATVTSTSVSEETEVSQVYASKCAATRGRKHHW